MCPTCPCKSVLRSIKAHVRANTDSEDVNKKGKWHILSTHCCISEQKTKSNPCLRLTWWGEGVGVALMEAAGEMLQHALPLLRLSYQYHHLQERSERGRNHKDIKNNYEMFLWACFLSDVTACESKLHLCNAHLRAWSRLCPVKSKSLRYSSPTARLKSLLNRDKMHSVSVLWAIYFL